MQESREEDLEPPKKRAKALAGLSENGELSSDEEDMLLPVDVRDEEDEQDREVMVPRQAEAAAKVTISNHFELPTLRNGFQLCLLALP